MTSSLVQSVHVQSPSLIHTKKHFADWAWLLVMRSRLRFVHFKRCVHGSSLRSSNDVQHEKARFELLCSILDRPEQYCKRCNVDKLWINTPFHKATVQRNLSSLAYDVLSGLIPQQDSPTGLQAAVAAGVATVGVLTSQSPSVLKVSYMMGCSVWYLKWLYGCTAWKWNTNVSSFAWFRSCNRHTVHILMSYNMDEISFCRWHLPDGSLSTSCVHTIEMLRNFIIQLRSVLFCVDNSCSCQVHWYKNFLPNTCRLLALQSL